jgi:hypothetical protein
VPANGALDNKERRSGLDLPSGFRYNTIHVMFGGRPMKDANLSSLKRPVYPMPDEIRVELEGRGLMERYHARPAYQQNDYIGWITRAKRPETRLKRLEEMLEELAGGDKYMKMDYQAK